ncbi:putative alanine aminotransferase [Kalaharituber pfeilii]|nr:putative alanine aminotransferase [Kalaharituber pfeilii]
MKQPDNLSTMAAVATNPVITTAIPNKALQLKTLNQNVVSAQYAVRGELAVKAEAYRQKLQQQQDAANLSFKKIISANIGNPQQLGQKPITFFRQVLSILEYPDILETDYAEKLYPADVIERARRLLKEIGSVGAYSHSMGVLGVRKSVAKFIEERDGYPSNPDDIFLTTGASAGVNTILTTICSSPTTGILIPVPQYPLYTATLSLLNATPVPYYLNELNSWSTELPHIREEIHSAKSNGIDVKSIVIINPGNPTGASLKESDVRAVIELAREESLVVIADEVYQTNVFAPNKFVSFKKVLAEAMKNHPDQGYDHVELVSLHSTSKGMVGECGHRGGYFELVNFSPEVHAQIYKLVSISLCPPVIGQALVELMVNPPRKGDPSYPRYESEYNAIFATLQSRAQALYEAFQRMEGVSCNPPQGSMYLFPTIRLPEKLIQQAEKEGKKPDEWYCLRMLDETGVCVVPGSGFGQKKGEWHFRTTFLAGGTDWIERIVRFHEKLWEEYR